MHQTQPRNTKSSTLERGGRSLYTRYRQTAHLKKSQATKRKKNRELENIDHKLKIYETNEKDQRPINKKKSIHMENSIL